MAIESGRVAGVAVVEAAALVSGVDLVELRGVFVIRVLFVAGLKMCEDEEGDAVIGDKRLLAAFLLA